MRRFGEVTSTARAARGAGAVEVGAEAIVFLGAGRPLTRMGVPAVVLRPGELLVAVELVMLCPEDARVVVGADHVSGPVVLGHEQVGRVVAVADTRRPRDVTGHRLVAGDRVIWAAGVGTRRYGHERVVRGWELSGGCATHVQVLARTPVVRVDEDVPAERLASASCHAFSAEELLAGVDRAHIRPRAPVFALADAEEAFAELAHSPRVALRPSSP
jgi:NADPH:quinone reductase-like Zn-dependent oxidoreductase